MKKIETAFILLSILMIIAGCKFGGSKEAASTTTFPVTTVTTVTTSAIAEEPTGTLLEQAIYATRVHWESRLTYFSKWNQAAVTFEGYYLYEDNVLLSILVEFTDQEHYGYASLKEHPETGRITVFEFTPDSKLKWLGESRQENVEYNVVVPGGVATCIRNGEKIRIIKRHHG